MMWSSNVYATYAAAKSAVEALDSGIHAQIIPFSDLGKLKSIVATPTMPTTTINCFHTRIYEGEAWRRSFYSASGAGPFYFVVAPNEGAENIKLQVEGKSDKNLLIEFFEDATLEALGTGITAYGFNRVESEDFDWGLTYNPTLGDGGSYGTKCAPDIHSLAGDHQFSSPGGGGNTNFTVLDATKIYIVKVTPVESGIIYMYFRL